MSEGSLSSDVAERNRRIHVRALGASKLADGLVDPKLVLSWLLTSLGAPAAMVGLLVPVRESLALLPQLVISDQLRAMRRTKLAWAAGAGVQGAAAGAIALAGVALSGWAAGAAILGALALLATARSVCSASYKHVLGKTVPEAERGTTTGRAASVAAAGVLVFAGLLILGPTDRMFLVIVALILAGACFVMAGHAFAGLEEPPGAGDGPPATPLATLRENLALLGRAADLRRFVLVRALLTATALAPPFLIALAPASLGGIGYLVAVSALAGLLSAAVWGRLSDRSSRRVLALAGGLGAAALAAAAALGATLGAGGLAALLFALMIAYHGVRLGRSTHLVDMADEADRAGYTATSNTVIGLVLLAGALYGGLSALTGPGVVLWVFAAQSALGALAALTLEEVQTA